MITNVNVMSKFGVQNCTTSFKGEKRKKMPENNFRHTEGMSGATPEFAQAQKSYITALNKREATSKPACGSINEDLYLKTLKDRKNKVYNNAAEVFGEAIELRDELQEKIEYINKLCQKCQDGEVNEFEAVLLPGDSEHTNILMEFNNEGELIRESVIKDGILKGALEHNEDGTKSTIAIQEDGEHVFYKTGGKTLYVLAKGSVFSEEEFKYESDDNDKKISYTHVNPIYGTVYCNVFDKNTGVYSKTILDEGNVVYYHSYTIDENGAECVIEHIDENT